MQIITYILTLCIAGVLGINAQAEAKSHKSKDNKEKYREERAERKEHRRIEKAERKEKKRQEKCEKKCGYLKNCDEHKANDFAPFPIDQIPKVEIQPVDQSKEEVIPQLVE